MKVKEIYEKPRFEQVSMGAAGHLLVNLPPIPWDYPNQNPIIESSSAGDGRGQRRQPVNPIKRESESTDHFETVSSCF